MDRSRFFAALRARGSGVFGTKLSQGQVDGMEGILTAFAAVGDGKADTLAYALATAYHETGSRMAPVREGFATTDAGARRAVNGLAKKRGPNSAVAKYARPTGAYGHVYYGRGHVQMTWLENYEKSSSDAGTDLVKNPDAMLDPETSARVLIRGLLDGRWNGKGKGLRFYLDKGNLTEARRTVNVLDKAETIAGYHRAFLGAIQAAGGVPVTDAPAKPKPAPKPAAPLPAPTQPEPPKPTPAPAVGGFWAWLRSLFGKEEPMANKQAFVGEMIVGSIVKEVVGAVLTKVAKSPNLSLQKKDVQAVTEMVTKAVENKVMPEVDAQIAHQTNSEAHWYQKRSFWSAIVSGGMVVAGPLLARYGLPIDPLWTDFVVTTLTTVGGLWAGYLAVRAGTATKPLGE